VSLPNTVLIVFSVASLWVGALAGQQTLAVTAGVFLLRERDVYAVVDCLYVHEGDGEAWDYSSQGLSNATPLASISLVLRVTTVSW
jgi:hypothetical protein